MMAVPINKFATRRGDLGEDARLPPTDPPRHATPVATHSLDG